MSDKKTDHIITLTSVENIWKPLFSSLSKFSDDFMDSRDQPEYQQDRESIF